MMGDGITVWTACCIVIGMFWGLVLRDAAGALGKSLVQWLTPGISRKDAKEKKIGELAAIKESLDDLVDQTRTLTTLQSHIQAAVDGDLWLRQMHLTQKRDLYASFFKIIANMRTLIGDLELDFDLENPTAKVAEMLDKYRDLETELEATMALARCFLSELAIKSLDKERELRTLSQELTPRDRRFALGQLEFALVATARDEFSTGGGSSISKSASTTAAI
jgi:hypothetical protein